MKKRPYLTVTTAAKESGLTFPTVNAVIGQLQKLGIVEEITNRKRDRVYAYRAYLKILGEGVQPPEKAT
jgi:Fic family protein